MVGEQHLDDPSSPSPVPHQARRRSPKPRGGRPQHRGGHDRRPPPRPMGPRMASPSPPLQLPMPIFVLLLAAGVVASEVAAFVIAPSSSSSSHRPAEVCIGLSGPAAFLTTSAGPISRRSFEPHHGLPYSGGRGDDPEDVITPQPIHPADVPELRYDAIDADWRREAELSIENAVRRVNGQFVGVTWFPARCVITVGRNLDDVFTEDPALHEPIPRYDPRRRDYDDFEDDPSRVPHDEPLRDNRFGYPQMMNELADEPLLTQWEVDAVQAIGWSVIDVLSLPEVEDRLEVLSRHEIIIQPGAGQPQPPPLYPPQQQQQQQQRQQQQGQQRPPWQQQRQQQQPPLGYPPQHQEQHLYDRYGPPPGQQQQQRAPPGSPPGIPYYTPYDQQQQYYGGQQQQPQQGDQQRGGVKAALGSAKRKIKEAVVSAKDQVVSAAGDAITSTSVELWGRGRNGLSLFVGDQDQQQQQRYSLSQYGVPPAPGRGGPQQPPGQQGGLPQQQPPYLGNSGYYPPEPVDIRSPRGSVPYTHQGGAPQRGPLGQQQPRAPQRGPRGQQQQQLRAPQRGLRGQQQQQKYFGQRLMQTQSGQQQRQQQQQKKGRFR